MSALEVTGGAGGVAADVADVRRAAGRLDRSGSELGALGARARDAAASGALLASAPLSPGTAARAEAALLRAALGPGGLTVLAVRLEALAQVLRVRARLLELADSGVDLVRTTVRRAAARTLGSAAPLLVAGAVVVGTLAYADELSQEGVELGVDLLLGRVAPADLDDRLRAAPGDAAADLAARALQLLVDHPDITDAVTGGLPDFLAGATWAVPGLPLPRDLESTVVLLLGLGRTQGLFADPALTVAQPRPASAEANEVRYRSLEGLLAGQTQLGAESAAAKDKATVRVHRVEVDGQVRWIVQVPGTQVWDPRSGADPSDLTSNLELMDDGSAALADAVAEAMHAAGVGPHDPVLLTGHSQGGIAAVAVASDPRLRRRFTGVHDVVTAGSPVGRFPVPDDVHVLSLEHTSDPVPRLDGVDNPDRPHWTTVRTDVRDDVPAGDRGAPTAAHDMDLYTATGRAVDESDDPALAPVRARLAPFLGGGGTTQDVDLVRPGAPR